MPNGNAVTNVTLATSESWKDKQTGQQQDRTEWHRVVFFGRLAEIAGEYIRKGSQVYVEGTLRTRKWQGQDGQDRYTTEIVVDINGNMQLLGGRGGNAGGNDEYNQSAPAPQQQRAPRPQQSAPQYDNGGMAATATAVPSSSRSPVRSSSRLSRTTTASTTTSVLNDGQRKRAASGCPFFWWRRGDLNPRPPALRYRFYMLSPVY